jgi:ATP-binding cassette, subfamily C, bacterial
VSASSSMPLAPVRALARTIWEVAGWRTVPALGLPIALGLSEGAGVLLLVPLLQRAGVAIEAGATGRLTRLVDAAFATAGVEPTLSALLLSFVVLAVAHAWLYRALVLSHPSLDQRVLVHYREALYRSFLHARWSFFIERRVNDLTHAIVADVPRVSTLTYQGLSMIAGAIVLAIYFVLALAVSPAMTGLVAACGVLLLSLQRSDAAVNDAGQRTATASAELHHLVAESLAGLKTARSYGAESRTLEVFRRLNEESRRAYLDFLAAYAATKFRFDVGAAVLLALALYVAIDRLAIPAASILILLVLSARIMPRLASLRASHQLVLAALPSFERVQRLLDDYGAAAETPGDGTARAALRRELRLEGVSYRYDRATTPAIEGVTLRIPAGETTALVGPSGGGKSTIADVLLGLLTPTSGRLVVDGGTLSAEDLHGWRRQIGYVPQDTFLLNDSVRANLLWAAPDATEKDLREALQRAQALEFTERLPAGLDSLVGDRGVRLSGGERQRLALARALLRRPALLILDEATSALDSEHERRIQEAIEALHGSTTIIVMTHRLSTVRDANTIHVIDRGRLVESGSWDTLVARQDGRFRALVESQHLV